MMSFLLLSFGKELMLIPASDIRLSPIEICAHTVPWLSTFDSTMQWDCSFVMLMSTPAIFCSLGCDLRAVEV